MNHQHMLKPMLIGAALLLALGVAGVPVGNIVPFLIVLACPLMMVFMMRGMDHGGGHQRDHDDSGSGHEPSRSDEPA